MRILITGGAGFLGSALANRLVAESHTVLALDDLTAGDPRRLASDVLFTRGDVKDIPTLWTLLQGVDCVYHLAARVRVPESIHYPSDYDRVNAGGTVAVMEAVRDTGVRRVVLEERLQFRRTRRSLFRVRDLLRPGLPNRGGKGARAGGCPTDHGSPVSSRV